MAVDDVFKVTIGATGLSHTYLNVVNVRMKTEPEPTQALFQVFADNWKEIFRNLQNGAYTWRNWRAVQIYGAGVVYGPDPCERTGGLAFEGNLSGTLPGGSATGDPLPPQCSMVVTLGTGYIGRRKRGRVYVFGWGETDQASGIWAGAVTTALNTTLTTHFNKYKRGGTDANFEQGIWSEREAMGCEYTGNPPAHVQVDSPNPDEAFTPITSFTVRPNVQTQRRRALGVGI